MSPLDLFHLPFAEVTPPIAAAGSDLQLLHYHVMIESAFAFAAEGCKGVTETMGTRSIDPSIDFVATTS
jgi:hypothetical protein